jgi:hypothetical protein
MCGQPITHFPAAYVKDRRNPPLASSPQYQEIDIGDDEPVRVYWLSVNWKNRFVGLAC